MRGYRPDEPRVQLRVMGQDLSCGRSRRRRESRRRSGRNPAHARQLLQRWHLGEADFVVRPDVAARHFADFGDPERLIAAGERAAEASLAQLAAVLERHRSLFVRPLTRRSRCDSDATCGPEEEA